MQDNGGRYGIGVANELNAHNAPATYGGCFFVTDRTRAQHQRVSIFFTDRAKAERCRDVLIADDLKQSDAVISAPVALSN